MSNARVQFPTIYSAMVVAWNEHCGGVESFPGEGLDSYLDRYAKHVDLEQLERFLSVLPEGGMRLVRMLMGLYGGYLCTEDA